MVKKGKLNQGEGEALGPENQKKRFSGTENSKSQEFSVNRVGVLSLEKLKLPEKKQKQKEKPKKIEEEKLEEVLEKEERAEEKFEEISEAGGRSNFNPEMLVLKSGQKLEQIEAPPERKEPREKQEKEEERRQISYAQAQIEEERNYQGSTPLPVLPKQEVIQERAVVGRRMNLIRPDGFQQQAPEEKLYETKRVEEQQNAMPWQSAHERGVKGGREVKYKPRA